MAGVTATIDIDTAPIGAVLDGLRAASANMYEPLQAIGALMVASTETRFETGKAPGGASLVESLRAKLRGGQTLIETGRLRSSFTFEVLGQVVRWGTNVIYAAIHQFGGTIVPKKAGGRLVFKAPDGHLVFAQKVTLPARPYVGVDDNDFTDMREVLVEFLGRMAGFNPQSGGGA